MPWAPNRAPALGQAPAGPQCAPPAPCWLQDPREIGQLQFFRPWGEPPATLSTAASALGHTGPWEPPAPAQHHSQAQLSAPPSQSSPSSRIPCGDLAWEPPMSPSDLMQVLLPAAPLCKALHGHHGGSGSHSGDSHCAGGSHNSSGDGGCHSGSDIAPVMMYQVEGKAQKQLHQSRSTTWAPVAAAQDWQCHPHPMAWH